MPLYYCVVKATEFMMAHEGVLKKHGCLAVRNVTAPDQVSAMELALNIVAEELDERVGEMNESEPVLTLEEIAEIDSPNFKNGESPGFIFFPDGWKLDLDEGAVGYTLHFKPRKRWWQFWK